jgi:sugar/nucleoside kinase (ribokinase family)
LAFVHLAEDGDRSFSFYRKPGADMMLEEKEIKLELIAQSKVFHFGSLSMTNEPAKSATLKAADFAKKKGVIISYDPNLRPPLWNDLEQAKTTILKGMEYADIVKISEEELAFLTGEEDLEKGSEILMDQYNIKILFVTLGAKGCFYRVKDQTGIVPGYKVKAIDTTGAGDSFLG